MEKYYFISEANINEAHIPNEPNSKHKRSKEKMSTIKVLTDTLKGGYAPIIKFYNENKPEDAMELRVLDRSEGGFELSLNMEQLKSQQDWHNRMFLDDNDTIKQLRWSRGRLESGCYIGFNEEETKLLFRALQHSLGAQNVVMV